MESRSEKPIYTGSKQEIIRKGTGKTLHRHRKGELEYLTFPALEAAGLVEHLFSTRLGGVSKGHLGTMNLSYSRGDEKERVDENFRRIAKLLHRTTQDFVFTDQTHTANIRKVTAADRGKGILYPLDYSDVDGLVTAEEGVVLSAFFADCVPLFFVDPIHRAIGLAHSGWRGTVSTIGAETVHRMREEFQSRPEDILAAIGPSICGCCYEVGEEVARKFAVRFSGREQELLTEKGDGKYQLDLWRANALILQESGIPEYNISITDICTCCNADYLFSHRASHGRRGNLGAFLSLKPR